REAHVARVATVPPGVVLQLFRDELGLLPVAQAEERVLHVEACAENAADGDCFASTGLDVLGDGCGRGHGEEQDEGYRVLHGASGIRSLPYGEAEARGFAAESAPVGERPARR